MENYVSKDICDERHKALENYLGNDKAAIAKHDGDIKSVQEAIAILTAIQARHDTEIEDHEGRIRGIESRPGKRWDSLITQVISVLTAAVLGGLVGHLL